MFSDNLRLWNLVIDFFPLDVKLNYIREGLEINTRKLLVCFINKAGLPVRHELKN